MVQRRENLHLAFGNAATVRDHRYQTPDDFDRSDPTNQSDPTDLATRRIKVPSNTEPTTYNWRENIFENNATFFLPQR